MAARADKIKSEIAKLQAELDGLAPVDAMGVREFARAIGMSPATAQRVKAGDFSKLNMTTAKKVLPFLNECPCCGKTLRRKPQ